MKVVGRTLPVWEMLVLRAGFALAVLTPALWRAGPRILSTRRPGAHLVRNLVGMAAVVSFYFALQHLELALVTTLSFTRTLFVILLAVLFLNERIRWRRTLATLVGFLGVLVCLEPGSGTFDPWTLVALAGALGTAGVATTIKRLTTTEKPLTIVALSYLMMGSLAAVPAALDWHRPGVEEIALVAFMGLLSAAGQSCMVRGLRDGEATAVAPFEYSRLLYAAVLGYLLFAEVPAASTWLGGGIIIASTLYIAVREARLRTTQGA